MAAFSLKPGISSVGVLNPSMRVFDIIMKTEYGTSYNAYLVQGTQKSALIETVHANFFEDYLANIESIMPVEKIDYLIFDHTEPDHSGSLAKLLEKNPHITVVGSAAALKYLDSISNASYTKQQVKDGDTLDLGGKSITFCAAPFLHWPDSMFSYVKEDKVLFTCDFLGAHYCEPRMIDTKVVYPDKYNAAIENYYGAIFSPFKPHVLKGLAIIDALDVEMVLPSHGPVLTDTIASVMERYRTWSTGHDADKTSKKVSIFYVSAYGCTKKMAKAAAAVLQESGYDVELYNGVSCDAATMAAAFRDSRAVMMGSPTINQDALKPMWDLLSMVDPITQRGKKCGVFGSYGWSGEAVKMLCHRLADLKLRVCGEGYRALFVPSAEELSGMENYTREFVQFIEE